MRVRSRRHDALTFTISIAIQEQNAQHVAKTRNTDKKLCKALESNFFEPPELEKLGNWSSMPYAIYTIYDESAHGYRPLSRQHNNWRNRNGRTERRNRFAGTSSISQPVAAVHSWDSDSDSCPQSFRRAMPPTVFHSNIGWLRTSEDPSSPQSPIPTKGIVLARHHSSGSGLGVNGLFTFLKQHVVSRSHVLLPFWCLISCYSRWSGRSPQ